MIMREVTSAASPLIGPWSHFEPLQASSPSDKKAVFFNTL